ncbi:MAG TPA: HAD family hydrolase [Gammaproteobacteria bacterium]|nr:HAD family hydrolase [Gammaproteobacteria bacterium]
MNSTHDLIVFDWDGTLMDSEAKIVRCLQGAAHDIGATDPGPAAIRHIIGLGLQEAVQTLFPEEPASRRTLLIDRYRQHFLELDQTAMPLFPGVRDGLMTLAEHGYLLAVATGKARRGLDRVLDDTDTRHLFVASRCADEAFSKPHPRMLDDILEFTGIDRRRAIMVGDTVYDMQMARNAGVAGLAVSYGVHSREHLLENGALACLDSFPDVLAWFDAMRSHRAATR